MQVVLNKAAKRIETYAGTQNMISSTLLTLMCCMTIAQHDLPPAGNMACLLGCFGIHAFEARVVVGIDALNEIPTGDIFAALVGMVVQPVDDPPQPC